LPALARGGGYGIRDLTKGQAGPEEGNKLVYLENLSCKLLDNPLKDRECLYNTVSYGGAGAELTYNFVTGIWGRDDGRKFKTGERVE
jgi:hypothetical protein